jgi:hypothetical protein
MRISMSAAWRHAFMEPIDAYPFEVAVVELTVVCGMKALEAQSMQAVRMRLLWLFLMELASQMRNFDQMRVAASEPRVPAEIGGRIIAEVVRGPLLQRGLIGRSVVTGNSEKGSVNLVSMIGLPGNYLPYGNCMFAWGVTPESVVVCTEDDTVSSITANLQVVEDGNSCHAKVMVSMKQQELVDPAMLFTYGQQIIWGNFDADVFPEESRDWDTQAAILVSAFQSHFIQVELEKLWLLICERGYTTVLHALTLMGAEGACAIKRNRVLSEATSRATRLNHERLLIVDAFKRNGDVVQF